MRWAPHQKMDCPYSTRACRRANIASFDHSCGERHHAGTLYRQLSHLLAVLNHVPSRSGVLAGCAIAVSRLLGEHLAATDAKKREEGMSTFPEPVDGNVVIPRHYWPNLRRSLYLATAWTTCMRVWEKGGPTGASVVLL